MPWEKVAVEHEDKTTHYSKLSAKTRGHLKQRLLQRQLQLVAKH